ncbi:MAG TPA: sigma-70 family RNA polymerase sigma factor [Thermodesulfovibrionales bacterium]|nr:sigma-70 family RNA polymerase sigma factor [Thermodesulfovibrionales bacterium]
MRADEDFEYVSLCKKGDLEAFEALVQKYQKRMLNIALRMTGSYEEACDIVQEVFVSVYRNIGGFEGRAKFSTWIHAIVMNLSRNRLKQMKARLSQEPFSLDDPLPAEDGPLRTEPVSGEVSALERLEKKELQGLVQRCVSALDGEFREVIILRDMQGFSYEEIHDMLKIPQGTVKSRLSRAREAVKDCLKRAMGEL